MAWFKILNVMFLPLDCNWGIQEYSICLHNCFGWNPIYISPLEIKALGSLTLNILPNKLTIVFLFQVEAIIISVALQLFTADDICVPFVDHSANSVTQLAFVVLPALHWGYHLWPPCLKVEDKNRLVKLYWFHHCQDPFTEWVEEKWIDSKQKKMIPSLEANIWYRDLLTQSQVHPPQSFIYF